MKKQPISFKFDQQLVKDLKKVREKHGTPVNQLVERAAKTLCKKCLAQKPLLGKE